MSRLAGRESSLLLAEEMVLLFGDEQPEFDEKNRLMITKSKGKEVVLQRKAFDEKEEIAQACVGNSHCVFLTKSGRVFVSGSNQFGQLGVSPKDCSLQETPTEVDLSFLNGEAIRQVDTGISGTTAIVTMNGAVYTAGESCGRNASEESPCWKFARIPSDFFHNERVRYVSLGGCLSIYITESGAVYVTGYNSNAEANGILGLGGDDVSRYCLTPYRIDSLVETNTKIISGCAGRLWAVVIDDNGRIYGWGCNRQGELGLGEGVKDQLVPAQIVLPNKDAQVIQVSCLWSHTLVLTSTGDIYSFGSNSTGQLGRSTTPGDEKVPKPMDMSQLQNLRVVSVHAGGFHSLVELREEANPMKRIYASCGLARHGQLCTWNDLDEVPVGSYNLINLCRKKLCVINTALHGGDGSIVYVPAQSVPSKRSIEQADDYDHDEDEEEDDDFCEFVTIDYSSHNNSLSDLAERILSEETVSSLEEVDICIANHYEPAAIENLTNCFTNPSFFEAMQNKLHGLVFVSTTILVSNESQVDDLVKALSKYPHFTSFAFDMATVYSTSSPCLQTGETDDPTTGLLFSTLLRGVSTLNTVTIDSLGEEGIRQVCHACQEKAAKANSATLSLEISNGSFGIDGFTSLASVIKSNDCLAALSLPDHSQMGDDTSAVLFASLSSNTTLHSLNLHVTELGHVGVGKTAVSTLVSVLESNPNSKLCKLDISGDDGEPEISADLQRRLTKCLVHNSKRNFGSRFLRFARMPVYSPHEEP